MTLIPPLPAPRSNAQLPSHVQNDTKLHAAAQQLEASFLTEMLKSAGLAQPPATFGGGAGEEHFASFLRAEIAGKMVQSGGIGLAEALFEAMKAHTDA